MDINKLDKVIRITFSNGISLDFEYDEKQVKGISNVLLNGKLLRNSYECIFPQISTPDGLEVNRYELVGVEKRGDTAVITTRPHFKVGHRMEWSEHALHLRVNTKSWTHELKSPDNAVLEWVFKEETEIFDGVEYEGFSYGFRYRCPGYSIYQIEDKATWELGGNASGNTFIMRGGTLKPVIEIKDDTYLFSGWDLPGIANPHVFQHMPLYTCLQGFTFQFDEENILVTVHERPSHVRSLFLKERNDNKLLHFNQFCFDLTDEIKTPARKILIGKRGADTRTAIFNHFLRVRDTIQQKIRDYYNIKLDTTRPSAHVETWEIANTDNFEPIWEQLNSWGIKRAFLMPLWRSNETDIVPRFKEDRKRFGVLGNMCCPLELEIAECYGGWDGFKNKVLSKAVEMGIETYMWFGSHFSSFSPLEEKINDIFARDVSGQHNRNNYGHVLFAVNQNSREYQEYLIEAFRKAKECGLNGVFRDSHFNMASDTINYLHVPYEEQQDGTTMDRIGFIDRQDKSEKDIIMSMHDTEVKIQSRFQNELGMLYYVESPGMIGTPMCGTDYEQTRGYEFIFSDMDTGLNYDKVLEFGDDMDMVYFRGLSVRLMYQLNIEVNKFPSKESIDRWWNPDTMAPMAKAFLKVEPYMKRMTLLEDENGIEWDDGKHKVVFAYKDFIYNYEGSKNIKEVISGKSLNSTNCAQFEKMHIYLID